MSFRLRHALIPCVTYFFFAAFSATANERGAISSTVKDILADTKFINLKIEEVGPLLNKESRAVILVYGEPEVLGYSIRNRQVHRLAQLYREISPDFPMIKFYLLELLNLSDANKIGKKYKLGGLPEAMFIESGNIVFRFKGGPDNSSVSTNEFRSGIRSNLAILAGQ